VQDDYEVWFGVKSFEEVGVLPGAAELRGDRRPPSPSTCARVAHVSSPAPAAAKHLEAITSEADLRALVVVSVDPDIGELPRWHLRSSAAAVQRRLGLPVLLRVGGRSVPEVIG
jgi:hypothetical protein